MIKQYMTVLFGMMLALLPLSNASAVKPLPPLRMTAAFDNADLKLQQNETLRVKFTALADLADLAVAIELPPEIAPAGGQADWQGSMRAGETRELAMQVWLREPGRYTINVNAFFDPEAVGFESSRISLNIIAGTRGVAASMEPFVRMDLQRARTAGDYEAILGERGEEELLPAPVTPRATHEPDWLDDAAPDGAEAARRDPECLWRAGTAVTVSGYIKYKDTADAAHPVRYGKVEILNVKDGANEVMGRGYTDATGAYSIRASSAVTGPNIQLRAYASLKNGLVANVGPSKTQTYYMSSGIRSNYTAGTLALSLTTGKPVRNSASDSSSARIFSVLDAILQASAESYALRGNRLMPLIYVIYPIGGDSSYYTPSQGTISILRQDALDWDVIMHEYGHFLSNKGASSQFDTSLGGSHSGGTTIPAHGKDKGVRLAWSEGFATWFSLIQQLKPTQNSLALPAIPYTGTRVYHDTEDINYSEDLETPRKNQGYAAENSLMALLYDMCDVNADQSADGLSTDTITLSTKTIWNILNSGNWDNVGKFYNRICAMVGNDIPTVLWFSQLFAMNNVGPELKAPAEMDLVSSSISPEFSWTANGDPTAGYAHNRFVLVVMNRTLSRILAIKEGITDTKHRFTPDEWQAITGQSDNTGIFKWAVMGLNTIAPRMPAAAGFMSNAQNIKIRAYHIRLRWVPNGADVDLHLRPPSGASYSGWRYSGDCAYYNRSPDWGVAGDARDNPYLDRDCTTSGTEENITLDMVSTPGTYKVLVHYYNDHYKGPATARVDIYRYGRLIAWSYNTLTNPEHTADSGDVWVPFTFTVGRGGEISMDTPETITRGADHRDVDEGIPPEMFEKAWLYGN